MRRPTPEHLIALPALLVIFGAAVLSFIAIFNLIRGLFE